MQVITRINLDLSYLHSVSGGDASFEKMLLTSAVADIQINIDNLKKAWQEENAIDAGTAAHTLKSVMTIAGLRQLENFCKRIDTTFRNGIFRSEEYPAYSAIIDGWMEAKPKLEELVAAY
ncbi:MAG: Hpt domain-containing protein [Chitinophagaceae bacterium]|nr:Hpt domain-containing protein [Chitinophagaceae bacterium]